MDDRENFPLAKNIWGPTGQFTCLAYTFHVSLCCPLPGAFPSSRFAKYSNKRRWMKLYPPPTRRKRIRAVASLRNTCACQGKTCLLYSTQRKTTCRITAHPPLTAQPTKPPPMAKSHTTLSAEPSPLLSPSSSP